MSLTAEAQALEPELRAALVAEPDVERSAREAAAAGAMRVAGPGGQVQFSADTLIALLRKQTITSLPEVMAALVPFFGSLTPSGECVPHPRPLAGHEGVRDRCALL